MSNCQEENSIKLLPCPFCGGPARMRRTWKYPWGGGYEWDVLCVRDCCILHGFHNSPEEAAELWNLRRGENV